MSHTDVTFDDGFHQVDFQTSLDYLTRVVDPSSVNANLTPPGISSYYPNALIQQALSADVDPSNLPYTNATRQFHSFLGNFSPLHLGRPAPQSLDDLLTQWRAHAENLGISFTSSYPQGFMFALAKTFVKSLGIEATIDPSIPSVRIDTSNGGDWSILSSNLNSNSLELVTDPSDTNNWLVQSFNHFLTEGASTLYNPPGANFFMNFFGQYDEFMTTTALLQTPDHAYVYPGVSADAYINLPSYQQIFQLFGPPDSSGTLFQQSVTDFVNEVHSQEGYFIPSHFLKTWTDHVLEEARIANAPLTGGSLDGNSSEKALVIDRILMLLIKLVDTIQRVGIAQASRLTYLTQFQQAYTALQTQIPVFLRGRNDPEGNPGLGGSGPDAADARNAINSYFNPRLVDSLRAFRGIQEDNAKKVQMGIDQSNSAANQQTDMITSFIQQLSTLLSTILR